MQLAGYTFNFEMFFREARIMKRKSYIKMLILGLAILGYAALLSYSSSKIEASRQKEICSNKCSQDSDKKVESSFPFLESLTRHFLDLSQ
ncbi:MAG: hypothetical protein C5B52_14715 [Bacteroidetes bacterium]|nr:MAG: hypothetical protein C5B52_14715 [Bacteroidota bacterium]